MTEEIRNAANELQQIARNLAFNGMGRLAKSIAKQVDIICEHLDKESMATDSKGDRDERSPTSGELPALTDTLKEIRFWALDLRYRRFMNEDSVNALIDAIVNRVDDVLGGGK